jgi:hypothetical protein
MAPPGSPPPPGVTPPAIRPAGKAPKKRNPPRKIEEEVAPVKGGVHAPGYGYVHQLVEQRERIYGGAGRDVDTPAGSALSDLEGAGGRQGSRGDPSSRRTKTIRNREIRLRRMQLIEPRVPRNYKLTSQVSRAGQALFADLCLRIPAVLAARPMQCRAIPLDDDDDSMTAATRKEEWTHAVLLGSEGERALLDQGRTSIWRRYWDSIVNAGEGSFQLTVRSDRWSEKNRRFPRPGDYADDPEGTAKTKRRTGSQKYVRAVKAYKQDVVPFVMESLDPQMVFVQKDSEGVEDEAVVVASRPYRETLSGAGLLPAGNRKYGTLQGKPASPDGDMGGRRYLVGPNGLGEPYPISDFPKMQYQPERVETATYYCSGQRARYLGLIPALTENEDEPDAEADGALDRGLDDIGVWAQYVDGVLVDHGPLWGPEFHPLPVFTAPGLTTDIPDPNFESIPVPFHLIELADLLDQIFTMELHVAFWSAFPPLVESDQTGGGALAAGLPGDTAIDPESVQRPRSDATKEQVTIEPGKYFRLPAGRKLEYLVLPAEATAHLQGLYQKAREMFDLLGVPSVFRGQGESQQPGYSIAQLMTAAKSLYDPIVDNATTCAGMAVKYLWWQVWRRFREGVPAFVGGEARNDKRAGWLWLEPGDVAPGADGPGKGVPFLQCRVTADPLLPMDEAQMELRGIRAVQAQMIDEDTAREKYFGDMSPEKTAARILGDAALKHPLVQLPLTYRSAVRMGLLMPELAVAAMAKDLGIDPGLAFQQLAQHGAFTPEQAAQVQQLIVMRQQQEQLMQAQAAMGMAPGAPGAPGQEGGAAPPRAPPPPPHPPAAGSPAAGRCRSPASRRRRCPRAPGCPRWPRPRRSSRARTPASRGPAGRSRACPRPGAGWDRRRTRWPA